jgi:uncharacterized protein
VITAVEGLIAELRAIGFSISVSENIDAVQALKYIDLSDRESVKTALGSVLVKDYEHQSAYDAVFDVFFALRTGDEQPLGSGAEADGSAKREGEPGEPVEGEGGEGGEGGDGSGGRGGGGGGLSSLDDEALREVLIEALDRNESLLLRTLARIYVARYARMQPGRAVAGPYYLFRTMRAVDPTLVVERLVEHASQLAGEMSELDHRMLVEDYQRRIKPFQQEVESEIRRRLVADRGSEAVAKALRKQLPEDVNFVSASAEQVVALREIIAPMTRKLAAKLAQKRAHKRRGSLDFRRTVRRSMSTGGVPIVTVFHHPRPSKPELLVLADISGSVSAFAGFTLQLVYALRSEFSRVRSFVFVDGVDEVTDMLQRADNIGDVTRAINEEGRGVWFDGRSDYGNALDTFWEQHATVLRRRTTVLILGDARNNYHASGANVVKQMSLRAGKVFWLNPEPLASWDSGDSIIGEYAKYCDGVFECRNVRQLRAFIERLD